MSPRTLFLTLAALIALAVGTFSLLLPDVLLASKGVPVEPGARIWVREVGVLLIAAGATAWLVRRHADSATLRALMIGNAVVQFGLLPIEAAAYVAGVITQVSGIVPNTLLHLVLGCGFVACAVQMRRAS